MEVNGFPVDGMEPEQVIQVVVGRGRGPTWSVHVI